MIPLLIVRPEPGANATAARAGKLGLEAIVRPLFAVVPIAWDAPALHAFDCVVLTSANAPRLAGAGLQSFAKLPAFAVGAATAAAAEAAGFETVVTTQGDAESVFEAVQAHGLSRPLHLAGRDRTPSPALPFDVTVRVVYAAEAVDADLPPPPSVVLLHSVRAATRFAELTVARTAIDVIAISAQVARAAGPGFRSVSVAVTPDDAGMLALAAGLCKSAT